MSTGPQVPPRRDLPDPDGVLDEVTGTAELSGPFAALFPTIGAREWVVRFPDGSPVNIARALKDMARERPYAVAMHYPDGADANGRIRYTHYTYKQLDEASDIIARGLETVGIEQGTRTALMVKPSLEFFALTFAIFKCGAVPVIVDPGIGLKPLRLCLAEAEPRAFIGIPAAHVARSLFGWARQSIEINVTVGTRLWWSGVTLAQVKEKGAAALAGRPYRLAPTKAEDTAAILFTSGSTGVPKGVVYQHRTFAGQVAAIREHYDIRPGEIDLPTFPLFALFDPALGMTTIVPDMDFTKPAEVDPHKVFQAIEDFGITNMFGSPALLNTVSRAGEAAGVRLPTLKRVISAGAPVPASTMSRMLSLLEDDAVLVTPYGATESLPVASVSSRTVLGETAALTERGAGVCVGEPVGDVQIGIIEVTDQVVEAWDPQLLQPRGMLGEIVVRGPCVTRAYYNREASTRLAKIPANDGSFWHRMGDLGYIDAQGRLWMCGRKSHRVESPWGPVFSVPVEAVFATHPAVFRAALVGLPAPGKAPPARGTVVPSPSYWQVPLTRAGASEAPNEAVRTPAVVVELEPEARGSDRTQLFRELATIGAQHPHTAKITRFFVHPAFPVDIRHNAKIDRPALSAWAARQRRG